MVACPKHPGAFLAFHILVNYRKTASEASPHPRQPQGNAFSPTGRPRPGARRDLAWRARWSGNVLCHFARSEARAGPRSDAPPSTAPPRSMPTMPNARAPERRRRGVGHAPFVADLAAPPHPKVRVRLQRSRHVILRLSVDSICLIPSPRTARGHRIHPQAAE